MSDAGLVPRSPLEGLALPAGDKFALAEAPARRALRLSRRRGGARCLLGRVRGRTAGRGSGWRARATRRAALWLGPDEWLLIAEGADSVSLGAEIEVGARRGAA